MKLRRTFAVFGAASVLALSSGALAQRGSGFSAGGPPVDAPKQNDTAAGTDDSGQPVVMNVRPPAADISAKPNVVIAYLIVALVLLAVLGVSLMPSKRTHQD